MKYSCKECNKQFEWYTTMGSPVCDCGSKNAERLPNTEFCTNFVCGGAGSFGRSGSQSSKYSAKIQSGSLMDSDIQEIMESDDRVAIDQLEKKENETYQTKKELDFAYGKDTFDGVDNDGKLYKDIDVSEILPTE